MKTAKAVIIVVLAIFLLLVALGYARFHEAIQITPIGYKVARDQVVPYIQVVWPEGEGPHPVVLMLHGCGGIKPSLHSRAREFAEQGYAAVMLDSFKGRDIEWQRVCDGRILHGDQRTIDVLVGLDFVRSDDRFDVGRIFLAGYSHGGWTALESLFYDGKLPRGLLDAPNPSLDGVRGVVAWYPYCGPAARFRNGWQSELPVLMLLAGEDQVTPPQPCLDVARTMQGAGRSIHWRVFKDAAHGFDTAEDWVRDYDPETHREARALQYEFLNAH